jgi:hypothetical protein
MYIREIRANSQHLRNPCDPCARYASVWPQYCTGNFSRSLASLYSTFRAITHIGDARNTNGGANAPKKGNNTTLVYTLHDEGLHLRNVEVQR